jgi:hypothetical protein
MAPTAAAIPNGAHVFRHLPILLFCTIKGIHGVELIHSIRGNSPERDVPPFGDNSVQIALDTLSLSSIVVGPTATNELPEHDRTCAK